MADLERFYEDIQDSDNTVIFAIVWSENGEHIGNIKLGPIDWIHRRASLGLLVGEEDAWGKGVGSEAVNLLLSYAFDTLNLHRVSLGVHSDNQAAIRVYEKAGFTQEGVLRENAFVDGEYVDGVLMGILEDDFEQ